MNFWIRPTAATAMWRVEPVRRGTRLQNQKSSSLGRSGIGESAKSFSELQLLMLLAAAKAHRERDWLLLLVCFWHGLRASELVSFEKDAIVDGYLMIRRPDGSNRTRHMLVQHPEPLLDEKAALIEFAEHIDFGIPVFNLSRRRVDQLMKSYCAEVGIPAHLAHAQTLRHTVARLSIESGGIEHARRWLGYKSRTSIYQCLKGMKEETEEPVVPDSEHQSPSSLRL
jgi:integrase